MEKHNLDAEFLNSQSFFFPLGGQWQRLLGVRTMGGKPVLSLITLGSAGQLQEVDSTSVEDRGVLGIGSPPKHTNAPSSHGHRKDEGNAEASSSPASVLGK